MTNTKVARRTGITEGEPAYIGRETHAPMPCTECNGYLVAATLNECTPEQIAHQYVHALSREHKLKVANAGLLAACKRLVGAIEAFAVAEKGGPFVNWPAVDASQDAARAAIARAEGGAS